MGKAFERLEVSRGAAFGDVDNDGDIDILLTNNNGPARLLRNDSPRRNWLSVQIDGAGLGIGARVSVKAAGLPEQWRRVATDSSYLSASDSRAHFGLGNSKRIESVTVHWGDGTRMTRSDVRINSVLHLSKR